MGRMEVSTVTGVRERRRRKGLRRGAVIQLPSYIPHLKSDSHVLLLLNNISIIVLGGDDEYGGEDEPRGNDGRIQDGIRHM